MILTPTSILAEQPVPGHAPTKMSKISNASDDVNEAASATMVSFMTKRGKSVFYPKNALESVAKTKNGLLVDMTAPVVQIMNLYCVHS